MQQRENEQNASYQTGTGNTRAVLSPTQESDQDRGRLRLSADQALTHTPPRKSPSFLDKARSAVQRLIPRQVSFTPSSEDHIDTNEISTQAEATSDNSRVSSNDLFARDVQAIADLAAISPQSRSQLNSGSNLQTTIIPISIPQVVNKQTTKVIRKRISADQLAKQEAQRFTSNVETSRRPR